MTLARVAGAWSVPARPGGETQTDAIGGKAGTGGEPGAVGGPPNTENMTELYAYLPERVARALCPGSVFRVERPIQFLSTRPTWRGRSLRPARSCFTRTWGSTTRMAILWSLRRPYEGGDEDYGQPSSGP